MNYLVNVEKVWVEQREGLPFITWRKPLSPPIYTECVTASQVELLYNLTDPRMNLLNKRLESEGDGHYRLIARQQAVSGKMHNKAIFKFIGHCLVEKKKDMIFVDQKYFQVGQLNAHNIQRRDIQSDVRSKNWKYIPGTKEMTADKQWNNIDSKSKVGKKFSYNGKVA